jgi:hypothetical protein
MEMDSSTPPRNINFLMQSKDEYISRFSTVSQKFFIKEFQEMYNEVLEKNEVPKQILREFHNKLMQVASWDSDQIKKRIDHMKTSTDCNYLDDLIQGLLDFYVEMLMITSTRRNVEEAQANLSHNKFIHQCYLSLARELWKHPNLMYHKFSKSTQQDNYLELEKTVNESILTSIRDLLPFKTILENHKNYTKLSKQTFKDTLSENEEDEDEEDDAVEEEEKVEVDEEEEVEEEVEEDVEEDVEEEVEEEVKEEEEVDEEEDIEDDEVEEDVEEEVEEDVEEDVEELTLNVDDIKLESPIPQIADEHLGSKIKDNNDTEFKVVSKNDFFMKNNNSSKEHTSKKRKDNKRKDKNKIEKYLGLSMSADEFRNNKDKIRRMLLHKAINGN